MSELVVRNANIIAAEINSIKDQTRKLLLVNSIEIGRRLVEAKEVVGHGEWGNWLENEVNYSRTTANNLMKIFNEYAADQINLLGDNLKFQALGDLSYTQAITLLGIPAEQREEFIQENDVQDLSTRELEKLVKQVKELEKKVEDKDKEIKEVKTEANKKIKIEKDNVNALTEAFDENVAKKNELETEVKKLRAELLIAEKQEVVVDIDEMEVNKELEEEINKLKADKEDLIKRLKEADSKQNNSSVKFRLLFKSFGQTFKELQEELNQIRVEDSIEHAKLKTALANYLSTLLKNVV